MNKVFKDCLKAMGNRLDVEDRTRLSAPDADASTIDQLLAENQADIDAIREQLIAAGYDIPLTRQALMAQTDVDALRTATAPDTGERLNRIALASQNIDEKKRRIDGYAVIQRGPLRDARTMIVDQETLNQVTDLGNGDPDGLKVRWTHPDLFSDHLGKYLGRAKNFRIDGDTVRADIHFSDAARLSPVFERDPVEYILALAKEDPNAFATSIYFMRDFDAMEIIASTLPEDAPTPIRIGELIASDIVDEGAAAASFFSKQNSSALPSGEGEVDPKQKEIDMADEAKKIEEAQVLAREEAKKTADDRLAALRAEFKDESDFVLEQFAKGHDVTEAKAEWADVLADRLKKSTDELEQLKADQKKTETSEGVDALEYVESKVEDGDKAEAFEKLAQKIAKEHGLDVADAYALAAKQRPDIAVA